LNGNHKLPVNIDKVIEMNRLNGQYKGSDLTPEEILQLLEQFIELMPYVYFNRFYKAKKGYVDNYVKECLYNFNIYFRSKLTVKRIVDTGMNKGELTNLLDHIVFRYKMAMIDYGMAVGVLAALSIGEPQTQVLLDTVSGKKTGAAAGGSSGIAVVNKISEILSYREQANMKNPKMTIYLKKEYEKNEAVAKVLANKLEMVKLDYFITEAMLIQQSIEKIKGAKEFGEDYEFVEKFKDFCSSYVPRVALSEFCMRLVLDGELMGIKEITIDDIFNRIKRIYPDMYILYNIGTTTDTYIMRCYIPTTLFNFTFKNNKKETNLVYKLTRFMEEEFRHTLINGINGIVSATVEPVRQTVTAEDGSIKVEEVFTISTSGSNLSAVLDISEVDHLKTQTNVLPEYYAMYGSAKTSYKILNEMRICLMKFKIDYRHYLLYVNLMTYYGRIVPINRQSLTKKERDKILLRVSQINPTEAFIDGAYRNIYQPVSGVSDAIILGTAPSIGTYYNNIGFNLSKFNNIKTVQTNVIDDI
jgi:DNA-directed RNA polymerase beta' subunit